MSGALAARLRVPRAAFDVDVALDAPAGQVVALLGPNGAGKSTVLAALAGLEPLAEGRVQLGDVLLEDTAAGVRLPPERRAVGVVFADLLLFPHLSARDNVAFGLRCRGVGRAAAREAASDLLAGVGLADVADARPDALSGGQRQRVALARALATQPSLLLLDEPLSALDADTRPAVRALLQRHLAAFDGVAVLVTHEPLEALALADRVVVVEAGRVVQDGSPADVARRPRTPYVARLVGLSLLRGTARDGRVALPGAELVAAGAPDGDVLVAVRPGAVALHRTRPEGSARNVWPGHVTDLELLGDRVRVAVDGPVPLLADVTPEAVGELGLASGSPLWASVKATDVETYPA